MSLALLLPGYQSDSPGSFFGSSPALGRGGGNSGTGFLGLFNPASWNNSAANIVGRVLLFSIVAAGLIFFLKLVGAGYTYLTSAGDSGKIAGATKDITNALIGLLLVVCTFFIGQILQVIFGITFL